MINLRMLKLPTYVVLVAFFVTVNLHSQAVKIFADSPVQPYSYRIISEDKKFVFVMLTLNEKSDESLNSKEKREVAQGIRKKYRKSGLYFNNDSANPLWTVNWYANKVALSLDGRYLVRYGAWGAKRSDEAFTFFENGKKLRKYKIDQLVKTFDSLRYSVSHCEWECESELDTEKNVFEAITYDKIKYTFDLTTGEILTSESLKQISCEELPLDVSHPN